MINIFNKRNYIKLVFNLTWLMETLKDLTLRAASDKILPDKAFNIANIPKYEEWQKSLALLVYIFFDKKTSDGTVKNENISKKELAEELHKQ